MHVSEDLSGINRKIIEVYREGNTIVVKRLDGSYEAKDIPVIIPNLESDIMQYDFVDNKPRTIENGSNFGIISGPRELDVINFTNQSSYLYTGTEWVQIQNNLFDIGEKIRVENYEIGRTYSQHMVVEFQGLLYYALRRNNDHPQAYGAMWKLISEYDLFVNVCEINDPSFYGYMDISGDSWRPKVKEITTLAELSDWFNVGSINGLADSVDGFFLDTKQALSPVKLSLHTDATIKVMGIRIEGIGDGKIGEYGRLEIKLDDRGLIIDRPANTTIHYAITIDGDYVNGISGNSTFDYYMNFTHDDRVEDMSIEWGWDSVALSKHKIGKITIEYKERS